MNWCSTFLKLSFLRFRLETRKNGHRFFPVSKRWRQSLIPFHAIRHQVRKRALVRVELFDFNVSYRCGLLEAIGQKHSSKLLPFVWHNQEYAMNVRKSCSK